MVQRAQQLEEAHPSLITSLFHMPLLLFRLRYILIVTISPSMIDLIRMAGPFWDNPQVVNDGRCTITQHYG